MKYSLISDLSFQFSLRIIGLYKKLIEEREYIISKQLLRCSTSIGANIAEAHEAFSKRDFAYKMSIAKKEARESQYWLKLLQMGKLTECELKTYLDEIKQIIRILTSIVKSTMENMDNNS